MAEVPADGVQTLAFSEARGCTSCGIGFPELSPQVFSFNSPLGMCPDCTGLGTTLEIDPDFVIPDPGRSLNRGAIDVAGFGGGLTASKVADAQAAYESANTMQPTVLGGVNFVLHTAGWLEGGLTMGYEKFILDVDQASAWHAFAGGVDMSPNGQALDALLTNEPGVHFLGHAHTLANFESAFWRSSNANNDSFEQWSAEGAKDANLRANETWKKMLAEYEAPPIDDAIDAELREFIDRKKASVPDANA
jgi:trimethylamine--corrinoid protein Co-methyltransferase